MFSVVVFGIDCEILQQVFCGWQGEPAILGRILFNQKVRFGYSVTSSSEWNSIFQNFPKRGQPLARYTQIFENFFPEVSFPFNFCRGISWIFSWMVRISETNRFPEIMETFPENSGPFAAVFEFSKVLDEWKAPLISRLPLHVRHVFSQQSRAFQPLWPLVIWSRAFDPLSRKAQRCSKSLYIDLVCTL